MSYNVFLVFCALLSLTAVVTANLHCYSGRGNDFSKKICESGNINYCIKETIAGTVTRNCDRSGNVVCGKQGVKCAIQGSTAGEICCCDSNLCNAATTTTKSFLLGVIPLAASLTASYMH